MRLQKIQHQRPISRGKSARILVRLAVLVLFLVLLGVGGWLLLKQKVSSQLRDVVQNAIGEGLAETGLVAQLGQARFLEGQGIQLNDLSLELEAPIGESSNPAGALAEHSKLHIYEAFLHSPASMAELVAQEFEVSAIEFRRAKLVVVRDSNGNWDFENVIAKLKNLPLGDSGLKPIGLRDCEVQIVDQSWKRKKPVSITGLDLFIQPVQHENRELIQIAGKCHSAGVSNVEFLTFVDTANQTWSSELTAVQAKLSRDLLNILPASLNARLENLNQFSGIINFEASAVGSTTLDQIPDFSLIGNVAQLNIDDPQIPKPIHNVSGNFQINNEGFSVSNASGRLGQGEFLNCNYSQRGILTPTQWHLDGNVNQFNFDHGTRMRRWLDKFCKKFCKEFSPHGTSNFEFQFDFDGQNLKRVVNADLTNMSFSFYKMPYQIDNCVGRVECVDDQLVFRVRSIDRRQQLDFKGRVTGKGDESTFEIDISAPGDVPLDQKLLVALESIPTLSRVVRSFQPTGFIGGIGRSERKIRRGPIEKSFDIRVKQCSIRHDHFDYPIHHINGLIQSRDSVFTFSNLTGKNGSGTVICNGGWNPTQGLGVRFLCSSIPLDDQLRFALKPEIREIWNGFRPRGTLDALRVDMTLPINQRHVDIVVEAKMNKTTEATQANYVSIHPVWFPYQINHVVGTVNIGDGEIKLTDIEGKHQKTWIACQGSGRYNEEHWSVKLDEMFVGGLKADEDFLKAIPSGLATSVEKLQSDGLMTVKGELSVAGSKQINHRLPNSPANQLDRLGHYQNQSSLRSTRAGYRPVEQATTLAWDLELVLNQAKMQVGFPIENVFGGIKLVGMYDGQNASCRGDLNIDSLTLYDVQVTKVSGPIWLDNYQTAAGVFANAVTTPDNQNNIDPLVSSGRPPHSLTGTMQDGTVHFDAQMSTSAKGEFYLQATLDNGSLKAACCEIGSQLKNIEGRSFAAVRMAGDTTGTHSYRGDGKIELRQAKIYELPVFLQTLKTLKIRPADKHAFDTANMDFVIQGETIDFKKMEFLGDAISLIGNGKMNIDWDIDLNFYSILGRNRINIPLISELYRAGSQKALWINVTGKLDNPKTNRYVLPQLNNSLQQIFQPQQIAASQGTGLASRFENPYSASPETSASNSLWPAGSQSLNGYSNYGVSDVSSNQLSSQATTQATTVGTPNFRSPSAGTYFDAATPREAQSNFSNTLFR